MGCEQPPVQPIDCKRIFQRVNDNGIRILMRLPWAKGMTVPGLSANLRLSRKATTGADRHADKILSLETRPSAG